MEKFSLFRQRDCWLAIRRISDLLAPPSAKPVLG